MKTDKFNIDDIVFFKYGNGIVKSKIEYIQYFEDGSVHYCIDGWCSFFKETELFTTLDEAWGIKSPTKIQLF